MNSPHSMGGKSESVERRLEARSLLPVSHPRLHGRSGGPAGALASANYGYRSDFDDTTIEPSQELLLPSHYQPADKKHRLEAGLKPQKRATSQRKGGTQLDPISAAKAKQRFIAKMEALSGGGARAEGHGPAPGDDEDDTGEQRRRPWAFVSTKQTKCEYRSDTDDETKYLTHENRDFLFIAGKKERT